MKKSDLRTGMIVTLRNGNKKQVYIDVVTNNLQNGNVITDGSTWSDLYHYNEDLTYKGLRELDIVKVAYVGFVTGLHAGVESPVGNTIWERKEAKQMTVSEIEAILGYKVEIVSEVK